MYTFYIYFLDSLPVINELHKKQKPVEINYICLLPSSSCLLGFAPPPLPLRSAL